MEDFFSTNNKSVRAGFWQKEKDSEHFWAFYHKKPWQFFTRTDAGRSLSPTSGEWKEEEEERRRRGHRKVANAGTVRAAGFKTAVRLYWRRKWKNKQHKINSFCNNRKRFLIQAVMTVELWLKEGKVIVNDYLQERRGEKSKARERTSTMRMRNRWESQFFVQQKVGL